MGRALKPYDGTGSYAEAGSASVQTVDLRRVLAALRRQRLTIFLPAALLGALGLVYSASKPETYSAYSNLLLDSNVNRSVQQAGGIDVATLPAERIENARVVLESEKLANDVLDRTGMQENSSFMSPPRSPVSTAIINGALTVISPVVSGIKQVVALVSSPEAPVPQDGGIMDPVRRQAAIQLIKGVEVVRIGQSSAIAVGYVSHDPAMSAEIANAYADAYVQDILAANANLVSQTNGWMRVRLDELQKQAQSAASEAERFAAENQLVEFSSGGLLTEQALNELNSSLTAALTESARAQAVLDTYERAVAGGVEGLTSSNSSLTIGGDVSEELRARLNSYNDVQTRLQRLLVASGPNHPQVAGLRQTLATTAERLFVELQSRRSEAQSAVDVANARVKALQQSVQTASDRNSAQATNLVRLRALQEKAATLSTLYQQTLTRSQEIEQQQSFPVSNVRILSYAQVPITPSGPAVLRTTFAATLLGLFLGLAIAALREWRERSLRTAADVSEYSGLRFLGHLPVLPPVWVRRPAKVPPVAFSSPASRGETLPVPSRLRPEMIQVAVPVLHYPNSVYAETLRHIRLASEADGQRCPVMGITAFHPFEGRSSVAFNLAGQLATGPQTVLLVDADSRGRALSRMLGIDDRRGLTDAIAGQGDWREMLVGIADTNLLVLPCGLQQDVLADDMAISEWLAKLSAGAGGSDFDRLVVDVPPLYPVAQGRAILRELQQFVIVAEWGRTPRSMAETALADDPQLESHCLGVVYDRVNLGQLRSFLLPGESENYLSGAKSYISMRKVDRK